MLFPLFILALAVSANGFGFGFTDLAKQSIDTLAKPVEALTSAFWSNWFDEFSGKAETTGLCKTEGTFPDKANCNKFYTCKWNAVQKQFRKFDYDCASGSVYDINIQKCEVKANATSQPGCKVTDSSTNSNSAGFETLLYCIYDLRMSYIYGSPDGVLKRMIGFNGQFPGPTLNCTRGKRLIVRFSNNIEDDEPTSIHFHGIEQNLSPFYDGPQSLTQCPIAYGSSMIYSFQLFQAGTYWYHSHHAYQYVDGAWGYFNVKNLPTEVWQDAYDNDITISVTDWIHKPARELSEINLKYNKFPDVNSSLINGRGMFDCSKIQAGETCDPKLQAPAIITVTRGKRYRIRVLNAAGIATYHFSIDNHKMFVIETDGVDTKPTSMVDVIELSPAHRYSVVVKMDKPLSEYWIRIVATEINPVPDEYKGLAILRYVDDTSNVVQKTADTVKGTLFGLTAVGTRLIHNVAQTVVDVLPVLKPILGALQSRPHLQLIPWEKIIGLGGILFQSTSEMGSYFPSQLPSVEDRQKKIEAEQIALARKVKTPTTTPVDPSKAILLNQMDCLPYDDGSGGATPKTYDQLVTINVDDCPTTEEPARMCMNGAPFTPGDVGGLPLLYQMVQGMPIGENYRPIYTDSLDKVIRLVINNRMAYSHPWHMHGHTLWVLGHGEYGAGDYNEARDAGKLQYNGVRRDTTYTLGKSWAVVSYMTDNPGIWFFHCHISWHLEAGLGVTFIEARNISQEVYKNPPAESATACAAYGVTLRKRKRHA